MLAPNSPWREAVTARAGLPVEVETAAPAAKHAMVPVEPDRCSHPARYLWAALLARIYEVFPLTCAHCGGELKLIAFVTEAAPIRRILEHLEHIGEPATPQIPSPARGPPMGEAELDQSIPYAGSDTAPIPEFEFDQSSVGDLPRPNRPGGPAGYPCARHRQPLFLSLNRPKTIGLRPSGAPTDPPPH